MLKDLASRALIAIALVLPVAGTAAAAQPAVYPEDTENWAVTSSWVKELPKEDQVIVLMSLALGFSGHVDSVLVPAAADSKGLNWVMKVSGTGNHMLMGLASKSDEMRQFFKGKADAHLEMIRGKMDPDEFDRTINQINGEIIRFTDYVDVQDIQRVRAAYRTRLERTESSLIAYAKLRASDRS